MMVLFELQNGIEVVVRYPIMKAEEFHTVDEFIREIESMDVEDFARFTYETERKVEEEWSCIWKSAFFGGEIEYSISNNTVYIESIWC